MTEPAVPELEELERGRNACDPNGDGFIDCEEFHQLLIRLDGDVSRAECELDFQIVDVDEDGYIPRRPQVSRQTRLLSWLPMTINGSRNQPCCIDSCRLPLSYMYLFRFRRMPRRNRGRKAPFADASWIR